MASVSASASASWPASNAAFGWRGSDQGAHCRGQATGAPLYRSFTQRSSIASFGHITVCTFFAIAQLMVRRYSGMYGSSSATSRSTVLTMARRRVRSGSVRMASISASTFGLL